MGKTRNLRNRMVAHMNTESVQKNPEKVAWIKELVNLGLSPRMEIIETAMHYHPRNPDVTEPKEREKYWINVYKQQGANLLNKTFFDDTEPFAYTITFVDNPTGISTEVVMENLIAENIKLKAQVIQLKSHLAKIVALATIEETE